MFSKSAQLSAMGFKHHSSWDTSPFEGHTLIQRFHIGKELARTAMHSKFELIVALYLELNGYIFTVKRFTIVYRLKITCSCEFEKGVLCIQI